jgi:hypothetical protein
MIELLLKEKDIDATIHLLLDEDNIIPESTRIPAFVTSDSVELRLVTEQHFREPASNESQSPSVIVYKKKDCIVPYDIEKKYHSMSVSFQSIFPFLHREMLPGLNPEAYKLILDAHNSALSRQLSKEESGDFIISTLFGSDLKLVRNREQLISLLIDIHLSKQKITQPLIDHLASRFAPQLMPETLILHLACNSQNLFNWITEQFEDFLKSKVESGDSFDLNFSHPSLSGKLLHLFSIDLIPKSKIPETIYEKDLPEEDRWLLILSHHNGTPNQEAAKVDDPLIQEQISNLRELAAIDQESFLVKTRKVMETVVNERLSTLSNTPYLPSLFEKLKYLEEKNEIPKTTATLFHTIRKLGNLGAHESNAIRLSDSEMDTILAMLTNILHWQKSS